MNYDNIAFEIWTKMENGMSYPEFCNLVKVAIITEQ